jgi:phosphoribosylformimino-5-aminoimidazole carboxamide ribotide isomerase
MKMIRSLPRIVPVLDLKGGLAVGALAGDRAHYRPLRSVLHDRPDPVALARACRDVLGARELYLADLDAIAGAIPSIAIYDSLLALGLIPWVDAGLRDHSSIACLPESLTVVAGLETLAGPGALASILDATGPDRLVFSLDLRAGRPLVSPRADWGMDDPRHIAERAIGLGLRRILLLDLARVGTGSGVGLPSLLSFLSADHPSIEWSFGGGVAGPADLDRLALAGASAVLVGSALHDGRIGAAEVGASWGRSATDRGIPR